MSFFHRNVVAIQVALFLSVFAWVFGGTRGEFLPHFVPWLWALLFEGMLFFPQRHADETSLGARTRVWKALAKDPLTWASVGFLVLLAIPFINAGLCPNCDAALIAGGADPRPPTSFLPSCLNRREHLNVFLWFVPALTMMLAVKHALVKSGKRLVLEMVVWNGVALSAVAFLQLVTKADGPLWQFTGSTEYFYATWGYPNMAADYFTTLFFLAIALWRRRLDDVRREDAAEDETRHSVKVRRFWSKHLMLIPAAIFFLSALQALSRAGAILVLSGAAILFLHAVVCHFHRLGRVQRVKALALALFGIIAFALLLVFCVPADLQREMDALQTTTVLDRVTGKNEHHARVASEIWKEHPLFGVGGWGYKHYCSPKMLELGYKPDVWMIGGVNTHNDLLQLLAEHGLVGFGLLLAIVGLLLAPVCVTWKRLSSAARFLSAKQRPPRPYSFFALPAGAFAVLLAALATLIHSFGDCPLRSPAVLTLFFVELAAVDGFLPRISADPAKEENDGERHRHHRHHHHHHHHSDTASA